MCWVADPYDGDPCIGALPKNRFLDRNQTMSPIFKRSTVAGLVLALFSTFVLQASGLLTGFHNKITEFRMANAPRPATGQIALIGIDQNSLQKIGVWPWPRSIYAKAIDRLVEAGASGIAFDVDFSNRSSAAEDEAFSSALRRAEGAVILPTFLQPSSVDSKSSVLVQSKPIEPFENNSWLASVNVIPDPDGVVRNYIIAGEIDGEVVPSLATFLSTTSDIDVASFKIDFSIDPKTIPTYSFSDLIEGKIAPELLRGKSVVIGADALELRDNLVVPVQGVVSGPKLQIIAAESLQQERQLAQVSWLVVFSIIALIAFLALLVFPRSRLRFQLSILLTTAIAVEVAGFVLQSQFALVLPTAAVHVFLVFFALICLATELDAKSWLLRVSRLEAYNTKRVLDQVFKDSFDAVLIVDQNGAVIEINDRFSSMFNLSETSSGDKLDETGLPDELVKKTKSVLDQIRDLDGEKPNHGFVSTTRGGETRTLEYTIATSRLKEFSAYTSEKDHYQYFACVTVRDVTMERRQRSELEYLSRYDLLTGAESRHTFANALKSQIHRNDAKNRDTMIFTIGLRRMRAINESLGRDVGDQLLKKVAHRLTRLTDRIAGVARLDGDRFAIRLVDDLDPQLISYLPERLLRETAAPYDLGEQFLRIDPYVGTACKMANEEKTAVSLMHDGEFALEAAQRSPEHLARFDPDLNKKQKRARFLEAEIDTALELGHFYLVYQVQVGSFDGVRKGAEALVRWDHPSLGIVSPSEFIEITEATGRIRELGLFTLKQACRDALSWPEDMTVSVNISSTQFAAGRVVEDIRQTLKETGLAANRLTIEITESGFLGSSQGMITQLNELKALGVSIALDDFGTGYSSLSYFSKFPIDKIKVDRSFVRGIADNQTNQAIIESVRVLADGLGLDVLCEGVETREELRVLRQIGCQEIQGYLFGKPMPVDELRELHCGPRSRVA